MFPVEEFEYPARDDIELVEVLQALGDPVMLQIVRTLDGGEGAIACHEMGLPAVSRPAVTISRCYERPGL